MSLTRAEKRRLERELQKNSTVTYNFTKEQLEKVIDDAISKELADIREEATQDAIDDLVMLFMVLPMRVLKKEYWPKTYEKKLPIFAEQVLEEYKDWEARGYDRGELERDLEEFAGMITDPK